MRFSFIFTLPAIFLLSACSTVYTTYSGSPSIAASSGSKIVVKKKLEIKPGITRVFLQDGIVVSAFNHYQTSCNIEVRKKDEENWQFIEPAEYRITGSQSTLENIVKFQQKPPVMLASSDADAYNALMLAGGEDSSPADIYLGIHYYLAGPDSNVMRLSCRGALDNPSEAAYPTRDEITQALGDIIDLKIE